MDWQKLFQQHIEQRIQKLSVILEESGYPGIVIDAGTSSYYFEDDQISVFRNNHHFSHWCPVVAPESMIVIKAGTKPTLLFFSPDDYWHDSPDLGPSWWQSCFDIEILGSVESVAKRVKTYKGFAYHGPRAEMAEEFGLNTISDRELARLNWDRSFKTSYEVACIADATKKAAAGHNAAKASFDTGNSERQIHLDYLVASQQLEEELPYHNIVCLDEKGAILHYTAKRADYKNGKTFLIDGGAQTNGYACDITRTWTRGECPSEFVELLAKVNTMQLKVCEMTKPGANIRDLHGAAHQYLAEILLDAGVMKGLTTDEVIAKGLTNPFFPHGIGHQLGLLVHDVAGKQKDRDGADNVDPKYADDPKFQFLRSHRSLEPGNLFTVEPGLYFIPMLLNPLRESETSKFLDWNLVDRLIPCGGIRIEDNLVVTEDGYRNITMEVLPH